MATYTSGAGVEITLTADVDQSANQYVFVKVASTAQQFNIATGASGPAPIGVLQNDPQAGAAGKIRPISGGGVTQLWCNGGTAIGVGDYVTCNASAYGSVAATAGSNNHFGIALEAVGSGCALISVLLQPGQVAADNTP